VSFLKKFYLNLTSDNNISSILPSLNTLLLTLRKVRSSV